MVTGELEGPREQTEGVGRRGARASQRRCPAPAFKEARASRRRWEGDRVYPHPLPSYGLALRTMSIAPEALRALEAEVRGPVTTDPSALERFARDASPLRGEPGAAVVPTDREEVRRIVRWARRWAVPLVGRGGGTSLDGESVPPPGALVVDFEPWNAIEEVDETNRLVRVGPGLINRDLDRALRPHRLFFPPNPGSWTTSTLGGNVATNASGPRSFRYGPTRAWVRGLEVVLGTGEVLTLGHRARRSSTGPDLLGFFVGSEGTLGFFTDITLALAPVPDRRVGLVVPLPPERELGTILLHLVKAPAPALSAVEYVDRGTAEALVHEAGGRLPVGSPLLLLELESEAEREERALEGLAERLRIAGAGEDIRVYPDADELWTLRGQSGEVLDRRLGPRVREDVAVPWSRLDAFLREVATIGDRFDAKVYLYGHLGDGVLHPQYVVDPSSDAAGSIRHDLVHAARRLGGTVSAEHGIGLLKAPFLTLEHGPEAVRFLRGAKQLCDPDGILNPGKLLPTDRGERRLPERRRPPGRPVGDPPVRSDGRGVRSMGALHRRGEARDPDESEEQENEADELRVVERDRERQEGV